MPRLNQGEDAKIDNINELVRIAKSQCGNETTSAFAQLIELFTPLILKICKKWSIYFNDSSHSMKPFDELVSDCNYWLMHYTVEKYIIGGSATYNTFIKKHLDQRVRYIYECELKYRRHNIFPDPDKGSDESDDMFDSVISNYSDASENLEDGYYEDIDKNNRLELAGKIMNIIESNKDFNKREQQIMIEVFCNGTKLVDTGKKFGISRTRTIQILHKCKVKLYKLMNSNQEIWKLICDCDIDFKEN